MFQRTLTVLLCLSLLGLAACGKRAKRNQVKFGTESIRAKSEAAQLQFDRAVTALEQSRWDDARQGFRLIQAEYPNDPISTVAEMYGARAGLREIAVLEPASSPNVEQAALAALVQLGESKVDDRIRFAALVYYAAGLATMGQGNEALLALAQYPSDELSPLVRANDRSGAQTLVGEALLAAGRFDTALAAFGNLHAMVEGSDVRAYSRARAFEAASQMKDESLVESSSADSGFVRAVAGWTYLDRQAPDATPGEAEALQQMLQRIAADMTELGEGARVAAISRSLANRRPPQRLAIGVALPLTGRLAPTGKRALDGALVALEAYSDAVPATTLIFADSVAADPAETLAAWKKDGVAAFVGPLDSKRALAWAEAANAQQVPMFAIATESLGAAAGEWAFRWFLDAEAEARAVATVAVRQQGDARIAVLHPDIGYGRRNAEWFTAAVEAAGGEVVLTEEYDRDDTDFSRMASRVARAKPDAIFIPDTAVKVGEVTAFLAQANVWGIDGTRRPDPKAKRTQVHYLGTSLWNDPALLRQARSYVDGALVPAWASSAYGEATSQEFFARWNESVGSHANDVSIFTADAVGMLRSILANGQASGTAVRDAVRQPAVYRGVTGAIHFGADGEPVRELRFITVAGGEFRPTDRSVPIGRDGS